MNLNTQRKHCAIVNLIKGDENSTVASVRLGRYLSEQLHIPYFDAGHFTPHLADMRYIFFINGPLLYAFAGKKIVKGNYVPGTFEDTLVKIAARVPHIIWVQNDYTLPPPAAESEADSPFRRTWGARKLVPHFWTTCQINTARTPSSAYVNWNLLGWEQRYLLIRNSGWNKTLFYYGAFREGRKPSFDRYFNTPLYSGNIHVSSTSKKFADYGGCMLVPPMNRDNFRSTLAGHGLGLYIEDRRSHGGDHSIATRFYEMLAAGLPMVFSPDTVPGFAKHGYKVEGFVAEDPAAAFKLLRHRKQMLIAQRKGWARDYHAELNGQIAAATKVLP